MAGGQATAGASARRGSPSLGPGSATNERPVGSETSYGMRSPQPRPRGILRRPSPGRPSSPAPTISPITKYSLSDFDLPCVRLFPSTLPHSLIVADFTVPTPQDAAPVRRPTFVRFRSYSRSSPSSRRPPTRPPSPLNPHSRPRPHRRLLLPQPRTRLRQPLHRRLPASRRIRYQTNTTCTIVSYPTSFKPSHATASEAISHTRTCYGTRRL